MNVRAIAAPGLTAVCVVMAAAGAAKADNPLATITVEAAKTAYTDTPVSAALAGVTLPADGAVRLVEVVAGKRLPTPSQLAPGTPTKLCWILRGTTTTGGKRTYELLASSLPATSPPAKPRVAMIDDGKGLEFSCGGAKVLRYHYAVMPPPKGTAAAYARSGFIHPIWSPAGEVLTAIHPKDHIHHMGLWNPWTYTMFEGRKVDFWNLKARQGTVRFTKFAGKTVGPVVGGFIARQDHVVRSANRPEKVALNERLDVRIWDLGGPDAGRWMVDYVSTQRCASASPLLLKKYRYGGLGFRGTEKWGALNSNYLTSEGKTRKDGHATRARWCKLYGTTDKGPAGVLILSHPGNHNHPEPMRIWPRPPHIFFNFCPIQTADWTLEPGNDYVRRYRLVVFSDDLSAEQCEHIWRNYATPPALTVTPDKNAAVRTPGLPNAFFALNNGTGHGKLSPTEQAALLVETGYDGLSYNSVDGVSEMLAALRARGLKMYANYLYASVAPGKPKYDPKLPAAIKAMTGSGAVVWLHVAGMKPSDPAGDERAVEIIGEIAEMAKKAGLRVALYPHAGLWIQSVADAVRVADKIDLPNVGVTFNLCHWLKVSGGKDLRSLLKRAAPRLFVVSINGADKTGKGWRQFIRPLDAGDFDVAEVLRILKELNFTGPIGLQCYGVRGDRDENLKRSMAAWRTMSSTVANDGKAR